MLGFSSKSEARQNYRSVSDQIITKIRFQRVNPKEDLKDTDFIAELESQINRYKTKM